MNILVTGSSGWLGQTLVPRLRRDGHRVVGLDPVPGPTTEIVGSIVDRATVRAALREHDIQAIVHGGALHKPHVGRHENARFIAVNVQGTLNLLEEAVVPGSRVDRFVFTSTTSLMISQEIREMHERGADRAVWINEEMTPLQPRNIYGVSKLSAEHLCRMFHEMHGLPVIILRTARFFPEEDDMAHKIIQSAANTKANEFLFRRLTVEDAAEAHVVALARAKQIGFDTFIISALTPFHPDDCEQLMTYAPLVVHHYFPRYREIYARRGWTMFDYVDRVYDATKAMHRLGFVCRTGFGDVLARLDREDRGEEPTERPPSPGPAA
jgi:UDP-glucose 4-epimerase